MAFILKINYLFISKLLLKKCEYDFFFIYNENQSQNLTINYIAFEAEIILQNNNNQLDYNIKKSPNIFDKEGEPRYSKIKLILV